MTDAARRELSDAAADVMDLESVHATFPDWRVYHVSGNWHAFRGGISMLDGPWSLLRRHLHAVTLPGLAERLCLQSYLDGLSDQELAEVWQPSEVAGARRTGRLMSGRTGTVWRAVRVRPEQSDKEPSSGAGPAIHTRGRTQCQ